MPYRRTAKYERQRERLQRARATRDRARLGADAPPYPATLPDLRMRIIIERMDFGCERHVVELHRTRRVDQYRVTVDGKPWLERAGLSTVLAGVRRACPRVLSPRALG